MKFTIHYLINKTGLEQRKSSSPKQKVPPPPPPTNLKQKFTFSPKIEPNVVI